MNAPGGQWWAPKPAERPKQTISGPVTRHPVIVLRCRFCDQVIGWTYRQGDGPNVCEACCE